MSNQKEILALADYYQSFEVDNCSAYLIVNKKMKAYQAMFGFTCLEEDFKAVKKLFTAMEKRAKELGFHCLIGPLNYSTWFEYRWAISNYNFKLFPDCTNPSYYNEYIKKLGYTELYKYRSAVIDIKNPLFERGLEIYQAKLEAGYKFKVYEGEAALALAAEIYQISKDAFADAYLYSDIDYAIFAELYLSWVKKLRISLIVAYYKSEAVGYVFGYPNPFDGGFISKTSAVKKAYQHNKLYIALLYLGAKLVLDKGYKDMIYHFQCEQKSSFKKFAQNLESNEKHYAIYQKGI